RHANMAIGQSGVGWKSHRKFYKRSLRPLETHTMISTSTQLSVQHLQGFCGSANSHGRPGITNLFSNRSPVNRFNLFKMGLFCNYQPPKWTPFAKAYQFPCPHREISTALSVHCAPLLNTTRNLLQHHCFHG